MSETIKTTAPSFPYSEQLKETSYEKKYGEIIPLEKLEFNQITQEMKETQIKIKNDFAKLTYQYIDQPHGRFWEVYASSDSKRKLVQRYGNPTYTDQGKPYARIMEGVEIAIADLNSDGKDDIIFKVLGTLDEKDFVTYNVKINQSK